MANVELLELLVEYLDDRVQVEYAPHQHVQPAGLLVALPLPLPVRGKVEVAPTGRQGDEAVDVATLALLLVGPDEVRALRDRGYVFDVPLLPPVGALDVVARVAALAVLAGAVARAALLLVVGLLVELPHLLQAFLERPTRPLLLLGLGEGAELLLARQRPAQLEPALPTDGPPVLVQAVLPDPVFFVDVHRLALPGRVVRVRRQQRAWDVLEGDVELHLEAVGALRHDPHGVEEGRAEVVVVLQPDQVADQQQRQEGQGRPRHRPYPELWRDRRVGVDGAEVFRVGLLHCVVCSSVPKGDRPRS